MVIAPPSHIYIPPMEKHSNSSAANSAASQNIPHLL